MKKLLNKGLVVVLALCMVFGMFTVGVSAEEKHITDYIDAEAFAPVVDEALDNLAKADMDKIVADAIDYLSAIDWENITEEDVEALYAVLLAEATPVWEAFVEFAADEYAWLQKDDANVDALIADLEALAAVLAEDAQSEELQTAIANLIAALQNNEDVQNAVAEVKAAIEAFLVELEAWYAENGPEIEAAIAELIEAVEEAVEAVAAYVYFCDYVVNYVYDHAVNGYYTNCDTKADYYVALGSATTAAADTYVDIVAKELGFKVKNLGDEELTFDGLPAYVKANAAEIAKATLITYNMDASLFVDAAIAGKANWENYFTAEDEATVKALINDIYAELEAAIEAEVGEVDLSAVPEVAAYVEKVAYAVVAYAVETVNTIEAIQAINPEALIMAVGMYNIFDGLTYTVDPEAFEVPVYVQNEAGEFVEDGTETIDIKPITLDFGIVGDVVAKACDLYYFSYAMVDGGFTVVDICGTEIEGFEGVDFVDAFMGDAMEATKAGQAYIAAQILGAFVLDRQHKNLIQLWDEKDAIHKEICTVCDFERIPTAIFDDVNDKFWATNYIRYAYENGIMNGKGENDFVPAEATTRAQFLTVLYRLETGAFDVPYEAEAELPFADVLEDELNVWYIDAMEWAYENGILTGYEDGTARPYDFVSRVELVTFVARYAEYLGYEVEADMGLAGFEDVDEIQSWGVEAMSWAVAAGVIEGYDDNTLRPEADTLRSEIATVAYRLNEFVLPDYEPSIFDILPWKYFNF